jgi:hypothetical protein
LRRWAFTLKAASTRVVTVPEPVDYEARFEAMRELLRSKRKAGAFEGPKRCKWTGGIEGQGRRRAVRCSWLEGHSGPHSFAVGAWEETVRAAE